MAVERVRNEPARYALLVKIETAGWTQACILAYRNLKIGPVTDFFDEDMLEETTEDLDVDLPKNDAFTSVNILHEDEVPTLLVKTLNIA